MTQRDELTRAILLVRKGEKSTGGQILHNLLLANNDHELAWLWMAACMETPEDKRTCFNEVLRINPYNPVARRELGSLGFPLPRRPGVSAREEAQKAERYRRLTSTSASREARPAARESVSGDDTSTPEAALVSAAAAPSEPDWLALSEPPPEALTSGLSTIPSAPIATKKPGARKRKVSTASKAAAVTAIEPVKPLLPPWALPAGLGLLLLLTVVWLMVFFSDSSTRDAFRFGAPQATQSSEYQVEYLVSGNASRVKVTYNTPANILESWELRQLPYTKTVLMPVDNTPRLVVTIENGTQTGSINCEIKVNGVSKTTNTSSAPYGFASCNALP